MTVLSGDPFKPGLFSVRLKIPEGGKVAAHWHPTDEHITVLQGTFAAGMGDKFDESALHDFPTGSYVVMPRQMHHFAMAKGETIVQITPWGHSFSTTLTRPTIPARNSEGNTRVSAMLWQHDST
ncbi:MAG: cupin domain-containing protein [Acidobacteriota bacterium]|nr:cupin domain-containing protein [Acidobacteriota bacterium]